MEVKIRIGKNGNITISDSEGVLATRITQKGVAEWRPSRKFQIKHPEYRIVPEQVLAFEQLVECAKKI